MASNPSNQYLGEPKRRTPSSTNRKLLLGLLAGGGVILLLCCGIGGIGAVWYAATRFGGSDGSGFGGDAKGSVAKVTEENISKVKTGMSLEEVEAIVGKGTATNRQGVYNLWQNNETQSKQVDGVILVSVTQWYLWTNGDLFLAVGLSPTRSRIERASVIVFRDGRKSLHARGDDPELRR